MAQIQLIVISITAVLAVAWVLARFALKSTASRDLLWRTTLIAVAVVPAFVLCRGPASNWQWSVAVLPVKTVDANSTRNETAPALDVTQRPESPQPTVFKTEIAPSPVEPVLPRVAPAATKAEPELAEQPATAVAAATDVVDVPAQASTSSTRTVPWLALLAVAWFAGFCILIVRFAFGIWNTRKLLSSSQPITEEADLACVADAARRVGLKRSPRLVASSKIQSPVVTGIFRSTIIVPSHVMRTTARPELRAALLHECGHVRRHDLAFELLLKVVTAALWPHPLVYVMAYELRRLREEICDNFVLVEESPVGYAEILLRLSVGRRLAEESLIGVGMFARRHRLESRVDSILNPNRSLKTRPSRAMRCLACIVTVVVLAGLVLVRLERVEATPPEAEPAVSKVDSTAEKKDQPNAEVKSGIRVEGAPTEAAPREVDFRIVTSDGKPVVGATITPTAMSVATSGATFSFEEKTASKATTDAQGAARLTFSKQMDVVTTTILGRSGFEGLNSIYLTIDHPNHPVWHDSYWLSNDKPRPIVLADSISVAVRARRENETELARRLYPWLSRSNKLDWSEADGVLTMRRVDLTGKQPSRWLRVIQAPEQGPAWFSNVVDLRRQPGNPISMDVVLKPGVRVEGRLAENVPRPVKNGRVVAAVVTGPDTWDSLYMNVAAGIAEDGTFVVESLPRDENLQVIALCDGWVSSALSHEQVDAYSKSHGFKVDRWETGAGQVAPQLFHIGNETVRPVIGMEPTASCEVTVLGPDKKPLPGAAVYFWPNHFFLKGGSTALGAGSDALAYIRETLAKGSPPERVDHKPFAEFTVTTNDQGVAVISNLPGGGTSKETFHDVQFAVMHEGYKAIANYAMPAGYPGGAHADLHMLVTKLYAGKTERITVRMSKHNAPPASQLSQASPSADGAPEVGQNELAGTVIDANGQPVEGVEVRIADCDHFNIRTDKLGRFRHKFEDDVWQEDHTLPVRFIKPGFAPFLDIHWIVGTADRVVTLDQSTYFEGIVSKPDGTPAANVLVRASQDGGVMSDGCGIGEVTMETRTDAEGHYKLFVQPGGITMSIRDAVGAARYPKLGVRNEEDSAGFFPQPDDDEYAPPRSWILSGQVKPVDIQLEPPVDFRFKFVNSVTGQPVEGATVQLYEEQSEKSNSDGEVALRELPPGECRLLFWLDGYLSASSDDIRLLQRRKGDSGLDDSQATKVRLNDDVKLTLAPGMPAVTLKLDPAVTISGRVLDPDGKPVAGGYVSLVRGNQHDDLEKGHYSRSTDKDGHFKVQVPASDGRKYYLVAHDGSYRDDWRTWGNGLSEPLETTAGQVIENVELRLTRPGVVTGRVVDEKGQALAATEIEATAVDQLDGEFRPSARSDRDGRFEIRHLRPGKYSFRGRKSNDASKTDDGTKVVEVKAGKTIEGGDIEIRIDEQSTSH